MFMMGMKGGWLCIVLMGYMIFVVFVDQLVPQLLFGKQKML